ncbi:Retrovirus-related Pol polyprotein from transposon RE2 [Fagus crenata]
MGSTNLVTWFGSMILINNLQANANVYFMESGKTLTSPKGYQSASKCSFAMESIIGYLDGSLACPLRSVVTNGFSTVNPAYTFWLCQDQLLLHAIIASVSESITPFVASLQTSREAWDRLSTLYSVADELALAGVPQSNDDLLLYSLRGLGSEYKEIVAAICARDTPILFEELHDKLLEQEVYLKCEASQSEPSHITTNATRTYSLTKPSNNKRNEKNHFSQNRGPLHQRNQFF